SGRGAPRVGHADIRAGLGGIEHAPQAAEARIVWRRGRLQYVVRLNVDDVGMVLQDVQKRFGRLTPRLDQAEAGVVDIGAPISDRLAADSIVLVPAQLAAKLHDDVAGNRFSTAHDRVSGG